MQSTGRRTRVINLFNKWTMLCVTITHQHDPHPFRFLLGSKLRATKVILPTAFTRGLNMRNLGFRDLNHHDIDGAAKQNSIIYILV